jgi:hypothetical protein
MKITMFVSLVHEVSVMKKNLLLICFIFSSGIMKAQVITLHHPLPVPIKLERISVPLRDIPDRQIGTGEKRGERENPFLEHTLPITNPNPLPIGDDPALQKIYGQRSSSSNPAKMDTVSELITVLSNWDGLYSSSYPSDNTIAVGPDHVVQLVNGDYTSTYMRVWDKAGNVLAANLHLEDLTGMPDYGDPEIIYDPVADRYAIALLDYNLWNKIIFCVSQTGDPMGSYYVYSFTIADNDFFDYEKIAVWGNSYIMTSSSKSPAIFAINRDAVLAGQPLGYVQAFYLSNFPTLLFQLASPVNFTGTIPAPAGDPAILMRVADDAWGGNLDSDHLEIFKLNVDWIDSSLTSITGPINLKTIDYNSELCSFNSGKCIPQPGSNKKLDPLNNILMEQLQYRAFTDHESIVASHVVKATADGRAGVRWYELRKEFTNNWYIYQQGTYAPPDTNFRWMSSITINQDGTIALGYNISSKVVYPGVRITGRLSCDSLNQMTIEETVAKEGSAASGVNRYGDYNGIETDPTDGSFWLTGQYNATAEWSTNVTHFTIGPCVAVNAAPVSSVDESFKIIPNPAANEISIIEESSEKENALIQVVDLSGKIVLKQTFHLQEGSNTSTLDVHSVPGGFYFVQLKTNRGIQFQRVVIQR